MGKFMEYRLEESSFSTKDFDKHEYFHDVLEHIVDTNSIDLGEKTNQTITKRIEDVSEFQEMLDDYKNVSQQKFDSVAKKFGFSWTKICKGPYSGRTVGTDEEFKNVDAINKFIEDNAEEYALKIPIYSGDGTVVYMTHAMKQTGTPKADITIYGFRDNESNDIKEAKPILWLSHKKGSSAKDFSNYGGISMSELENLPKSDLDVVKHFIVGVKILFTDKEGKRSRLYDVQSHEINDALSHYAVYGKDFGGDFGKNNVDFLLQGDIRLEKRGNAYEFTANYVEKNPEIPTGDRAPKFCTKTANDRTTWGVVGMRMAIYPDAYHKSAKDLLTELNKKYETKAKTLKGFIDNYFRNEDIDDFYHTAKMLSYRDVLGFKVAPKDNANESVSAKHSRNLIVEGGASGHMAHVFEDGEMTFAEMKEIFRELFSGELKVEEKTDGIALAVTYKDGEVKAARNKATLKDPMSISQLEQKFEGRGEIKDAFVNSMKDISSAISKMSESELKKIFNDGQNYMAFEIIYPPTKNVVDYGSRCLIQLHGINVYNEKWEKVSEDKEAADRLYNFLKKHGALNQETFEITNHAKLKLKDTSTAKESYNAIAKKIDEVKGDAEDNETINKYVVKKYISKIQDLADEKKISISDSLAENLAERLSYYSGKKVSKVELARIAKESGVDPKSSNYKDFLSKLESTQAEDNQEFILPLEEIVIDAGLQLMKNLSGYVIADRSQSAKILSKQLEDEIKYLEDNKDKLSPGKMKVLEKSLRKLNKFGKELTGVEGIVFLHKGKVYKLTGTFGACNQLLGIMKYDRGGSSEEVAESFDADPKKFKKTVALVAGSYKPPTAAHWDMVQKYAKMADEVDVLISTPKSEKSIRKTSAGTVITPEMAKEIFEIYSNRYGLNGKVKIEVSDQASPITSAFDKIDKLTDCNVVLGVSKKGDDLKRFASAKKYVDERDDLNLIDPVKTAIEPFGLNGFPISATEVRNNIDKPEIVKKYLPSKLTEKDVEKILEILNPMKKESNDVRKAYLTLRFTELPGTLEKYKTSFEKKHGVEVVAIRPTKKGFNKTIRGQKVKQYDFIVAGDESTLKELFAKYRLTKTFEKLPQSMKQEFEKNLVDSENEFGSLL